MDNNIIRAIEDNAGHIYLTCAGQWWDVTGVIGESDWQDDFAAIRRRDTDDWTVDHGTGEIDGVVIAEADDNRIILHDARMGLAGRAYFGVNREDEEEDEGDTNKDDKKEGRRKLAAVEWDEDSVAEEMGAALDLDPDDLEVSEMGDEGVTYYEVIGGPGEWLVFTDYDDAARVAQARVLEDLESDPALFNQDWLRQYVYISDTDARLGAQDLVGDYPYEIEEDRVYNELGADPDEMDIDEAREELAEKMQDDIEQELKSDPIGYLVEDQGIYTLEELMKANFIQIDVQEAAVDSIRADGAAHFLAGYDGEENESENGLYYYRTN